MREDGRELLDDLPRVDGDLGADQEIPTAADRLGILVCDVKRVHAVVREGGRVRGGGCAGESANSGGEKSGDNGPAARTYKAKADRPART